MKKYDYIVFDLDGTIIDIRKKFYECYKDIVIHLDRVPIDSQQYWELRGEGMSGGKILEYTGMADIKTEFLAKWVNNIESKEMLRFDEVTCDLGAVIPAVKSANTQIILLTMRHNVENLMWQLDVLKIENYFDTIIAAGNRQVTDKLELFPTKIQGNVLVIGDTAADERFAEEIHADFIPVDSGLKKWKNGYSTLNDTIAEMEREEKR